MPIHDWTRVDAGVFHDFHTSWVPAIKRALNGGVLPPGYYAMAEQTADRTIPDVLTLHSVGPEKPAEQEPTGFSPPREPAVSTLPRVRFHEKATLPYARKTRSIVVRHVTGDRAVAMIELVSPGNKSCRRDLRAFVEKVAGFIGAGIHVLVVDLFPPGPRDRHGIHRAIWSRLARSRFKLSPDEPLTLVSYLASPPAEAFVEPVAVGDRLRDMPLFLTPDVHVPVPLEATYAAAWAETPERLRNLIASPAV